MIKRPNQGSKLKALPCTPNLLPGFSRGFLLRTPNYKKRSLSLFLLFLSLFLSNISKYLFALIALFCFLSSPYLAQAKQIDTKNEIITEIYGLKKDSAELRERVAKIEGTLEQMDKRLNHFGDRLLSIENKMDTKFAQMDAKFESKFGQIDNKIMGMDNKIMGLYNIIIGMWVTIMLAIAGLFVTIILSSRRKT